MNNSTTNPAPMTRAHLASLIGKTEAELDGPTPFEVQSALQAVTDWAMKAAAEHVDLAHHNGERVDSEWCMGLWQTFLADFDKSEHDRLGVRDLAVNTASHAFRRTVELLDAKARQCAALEVECKADGVVHIDQTPGREVS